MSPMRCAAERTGRLAARSIGGERHAWERPSGIDSNQTEQEPGIRRSIGGHTSRVDDVEKVGSTAPATLPVASSGAVGEKATVAERWTCFRAGMLPTADWPALEKMFSLSSRISRPPGSLYNRGS